LLIAIQKRTSDISDNPHDQQQSKSAIFKKLLSPLIKLMSGFGIILAYCALYSF